MRSSRELFRKSNNQVPRSNDPSISFASKILTNKDQNKANDLYTFHSMVDTPEPEKLVPIATVEARKRSCVEVIDTDEGI